MTSSLTPVLRERIENTIRFLAADAVQRAQSGHPGAPMGLARPALELWDRHMVFDPHDPGWLLRDRFVLSNGHASLLQYALLHLNGFDLGLQDLIAFRTLGSRTPGHPEYGDTPGVELTTGPLGQGFAHGVGMAIAGRLAHSQFGTSAAGQRGPGQHFVYGIVSDGDLMEGISSEAGSLAGHLGLGNLVYLYDDNHITIDGPTSLSFSEDVPRRFEAFGWHVERVVGEDYEGLASALERSRAETDRPSLIATRTVIGRGAPTKAGTSAVHGSPLGEDEVRAAKEAVGWPADEPFFVPDDVKAYFKERSASRERRREELDREHAAWREAQPERAAAFDAARERRMPADLAARLVEGMAEREDATRNHGKVVLERLAELVPYMVGGSADLAGSGAPPVVKSAGIVGPGSGVDPFAGRNLHFGIREHAMAAITNGIALDGTFVPYCGTFLIFSDYLRPALRLSALMGLRSIFVFTHDSIFVGEDGPTHQPIEQLDSLRALPGFTVFRPADGVETALAWAWILERAEGPAMLALTRQKVPPLARPASFEPADVQRGGYVVREAAGAPRVVLLASGSEVALACEAAERLEAAGTPARVVSIPCLELFEQQPDDYQLACVPDDGSLLVAVEAARGESYRRFVGRNGIVYGMPGFGASGPWKDLAKHFGFTPEALVARIEQALG